MNVVMIFRNLISFLTSIPMGTDKRFVEVSARYMFLFPIIGAIIGLLAGIYWNLANLIIRSLLSSVYSIIEFASPFLTYNVLAKTLTSLMTLSFILVLTGLQHADGLVDVGNALHLNMPLEDRRKIAHDWIVTRLGALFAIAVVFSTFLFISLLKQDFVVQGLLVSEVSAKLAMVTCAWHGNPANSGLGSIFVKTMRHKHSFYLLSLCISCAVSFFALGLQGFVVLSSGIIVGLLMIELSNRVFGWMTGDIFGSANEIARMMALIFLVVLQ